MPVIELTKAIKIRAKKRILTHNPRRVAGHNFEHKHNAEGVQKCHRLLLGSNSTGLCVVKGPNRVSLCI